MRVKKLTVEEKIAGYEYCLLRINGACGLCYFLINYLSTLKILYTGDDHLRTEFNLIPPDSNMKYGQFWWDAYDDQSRIDYCNQRIAELKEQRDAVQKITCKT